AYTVACSLYALGFAGYFWEFFHKYVPGLTESLYSIVGPEQAVLAITFLIGVMFTWLNVRGAEVTGKTENILTISKIIVLAVFIFYGLRKIMEQPTEAMESFTPFFPTGLGGVIVAMGLTFIAFEGYDLIATVAEEIKQPEKNIPRATFIALGMTVLIYLLILFVSLGAVNPDGLPGWQFLGKFKETAIVRAAEGFMPAFGVAVIVFGGLLSTMSALNATVMAASRVAFSMGRDLWLPKKMATINVKTRTPHVAIFVTGIILVTMALTLPIEAVGSAASLIFLLSFALVNLAVIVLRRKHPEIPRKYKVPLYPVIPVLGFLLNIFLALYQFKFQPIAWFVTIGWVAVGLLLYYAVFEKRSAELVPQVLMPRRAAGPSDIVPSVLVALHNPDNVETLMNLAISETRRRESRLIAISVVDVPRQMPIHEGMRFANHKTPLLNKAQKIAAENKIGIETDLIIAHNVADGILASIEQHRAESLVMGWKGHARARDRIFGEITDKVVRMAPCDLLLLKIGEKKRFEKCLFPTAGGPHALLAADVLDGFIDHNDMKLTLSYVVNPDAPEIDRENGRNFMQTTKERISQAKDVQSKIIESKSIAGGIAKAGRDYDLLIIGAAREPMFQKVLFGEIPEKVARYSPTSVLVVKRYEGAVKSIIKKIFG
ncbi:MAG: amino acid permease, partial [candidate division Zixibacteria bacterium]|nr:amino acid permease [candidate division Zixibacteria bacterium]